MVTTMLRRQFCFFSSRRRHTRLQGDWSSDVCSSDLGPRVAEFERRGAELLAKQLGVMVNSGTSALWLAVDLLGCQPGDEVITSPLTFSSDVAPLVRSGIIPVFVDVEADTYQIDAEKIEAMIGPRTKAI